MTPDLTAVVTTYRQPRSLRLTLTALAEDARRAQANVELIVADDGDPDRQGRAGAAAFINERSFMNIRSLWQARDGFGKCRLANKAIAAARAPTVLFLDGDCLLAPGALAAHLKLAGPRRYVAGSALRLGRAASEALDEPAVRAGRHASMAFLGRQALRGEVESKAHYAFLRPVGRLFRRTGSGGFNGGCSSVSKALLEEVDGWDESLGYGFEDTDLGHRLQNAGAEPVAARVEALVVHLWHERPYRDAAAQEAQRARVSRSLHGAEVRAVRGMSLQTDRGEWEDLC